MSLTRQRRGKTEYVDRVVKELNKPQMEMEKNRNQRKETIYFMNKTTLLDNNHPHKYHSDHIHYQSNGKYHFDQECDDHTFWKWF